MSLFTVRANHTRTQGGASLTESTLGRAGRSRKTSHVIDGGGFESCGIGWCGYHNLGELFLVFYCCCWQYFMFIATRRCPNSTKRGQQKLCVCDPPSLCPLCLFPGLILTCILSLSCSVTISITVFTEFLYPSSELLELRVIWGKRSELAGGAIRESCLGWRLCPLTVAVGLIPGRVPLYLFTRERGHISVPFLSGSFWLLSWAELLGEKC